MENLTDREIVNAKLRSERAYVEQNQAMNPAGTTLGKSIHRSLADEKLHEANRHFDQGSKAQMAAAFLQANPAFEEFIKLVRNGSIQF